MARVDWRFKLTLQTFVHPHRSSTMNSSETTFFRAGYVTSLEAWKRYLADGHNIHFRAKPDKPDQDEDEDESEDEDQDEEDDNDGNGDDENRRPPPSEEAREMMEKSDAIFQFVSRSRQAFRNFYRKAPLEVRTRLVLPHSESLGPRSSLRPPERADDSLSLYPHS